MISIAIIEDEEVHRKLLEQFLTNWSKANNTMIGVSCFTSAESFLFEWEIRKDFDILFVDIQMKAMNGMDMAKRIREKDADISIVFTTGIMDYVQEGYEVAAMYYLTKPLAEEKVRKCMDKVCKKRKMEKYVLVHTGEELRRLAECSITYIEARGHGAVLEMKLPDGTYQLLEVTESISELEKVLDAARFVKCHRSYLCNIECIANIGKTGIVLDSKSEVPVSRRMYESVNRAFIRYFSDREG